DLHHLLAGETAAGGELGDRFEVVVLPTWQAPAQHASRDAADVLEAVHDVARDEDDAAGTRLGGLIAQGHLREAFDDEQNLFLFKMDMVGRAFAGLVPRHDDRGGAAGGLGREEHIHVEAERLDRQRLFGRNDGGLQWGSRVHGCCLQFFTTHATDAAEERRGFTRGGRQASFQCSSSFALLFPNLLTSRLAWSRVMPCACTKLAISIDEANLLGPGMWSLGIVSPLALCKFQNR